MNDTRVFWFALAAGLLMFLAGFATGRNERISAASRPEPPAQAITHKDGSQTLARTDAPPPPPLQEPPGTVARTRAEVLELKPMTTRSSLQLDLVVLKDGTERVTAKGEALESGQDFSIAIPARPVKKWTLGGGVGFKRYTGIALKSWGPADIGLVIQRDRKDSRDWDVQAVAVFRF